MMPFLPPRGASRHANPGATGRPKDPPARLPGGAETAAPRKADCLPQKPPPSGVFPPGGGPFGGE